MGYKRLGLVCEENLVNELGFMLMYDYWSFLYFLYRVVIIKEDIDNGMKYSMNYLMGFLEFDWRGKCCICFIFCFFCFLVDMKYDKDNDEN